MPFSSWGPINQALCSHLLLFDGIFHFALAVSVLTHIPKTVFAVYSRKDLVKPLTNKGLVCCLVYSHFFLLSAQS